MSVKYRMFCASALLMCMTSGAIARDRIISFQSNSSAIGPEAHIVYFNDTQEPQSILIAFGVRGLEPEQWGDRNCEFAIKSDQSRGSNATDKVIAISRRYGGFEQVESVARIPPGEFAHRYWPSGARGGTPCEVSALVNHLPLMQPPAVIQVQVEEMKTPLSKSPARYSVRSSVEKTVGKLIRVTTLLSNSSQEWTTLKLRAKALLGCRADIADNVVRQGMEGGFIELPPSGHAIYQTAVLVHTPVQPRACRLLVTFDDLGGNSIRSITVEISPKGTYEVPPAFRPHK